MTDILDLDGWNVLARTELGRSKDDKANVVALVRGNTRRQQLICTACNVGFHTEALNHRAARSTQKSG